MEILGGGLRGRRTRFVELWVLVWVVRYLVVDDGGDIRLYIR
jgi:hypothetical protein